MKKSENRTGGDKPRRLASTVNGFFPIRLGDEKPLVGEPQGEPDTDDLIDRIHCALCELFRRAYAEDGFSLCSWVDLLRLNIGWLQKLADEKLEFVKGEASKFDEWPALIKLNQKDINREIERCRQLEIGKRFLCDMHNRRNIDLQNLWTKYALAIVRTLSFNRKYVAERLARIKQQGGCQVDCGELGFDDTKLKLSSFFCNGRFVELTEWAIDCVHLDERITRSNFKKWWGIGRLAILHYWWNNRARYAEAISQIRYADADTEGRKREHALNQIRKALHTLVRINHPSLRQHSAKST